MWLTRNSNLARDVPNFFDTFWDDVIKSSPVTQYTQYKGVKIWEEDEAVFVELVIPGVPKEHVSVEVADDVLTVSYKHGDVAEASYGYCPDEFTYSWKFSDSHDQGSISAKSLNGILTIKVGKVEPPQPESKTVKIA